MKDDLIGRLRAWERFGGFVEHERVFYGAATGEEYRTKDRTPTIIRDPKPLLNEAADEIERLRARVAELEATVNEWAGV